MNIGDQMTTIVVDKGQQTLPSWYGTERVYYDVYCEVDRQDGPKYVLFQHELFEAFMDEIRKARKLAELLKPINHQIDEPIKDEHIPRIG